MNYSLRQLLLVSLLSASMLIWGVAAYISYKGTRDEVANLFDAELAQSAKVLHAFVESLLREGSLSPHWSQEQADKHLQAYALGHKFKRKSAFQLWSEDEGLLLRSESAPKYAFSTEENGFSEANIDSYLWHVFSITNATGEYIVHVGQREEIRAELTDEISTQLVTQFLIGLPFLGVVIWFIVGLALKPLNRLERSLAKREASYLKPLSTRQLPNEIVPVVHEINTLFTQLEEAFEHERRFTADAAHELRTPLAGLLTQAQVALRTHDDDTRTQALKRIEQAVNRMTYLVQQLLTFSRIESSTEFLTKESVQLEPEVVRVIADLEPDAYKKRINIEFVEDNPQPIVINVPLITILMRNIIDNAIKYTPPKGNILISVTGKDTVLQLSVEDSGPGIAPDQYENSLKRFHRCVETANKAQGTGLGFSIVERIASIHNADLVLGVSQFGGLKVSLLFPLLVKPIDKVWQRKLSFFNVRQFD